jgi:hypothetical protein
VRGKPLEPVVDVLEQPRLVVVHVDGRRDVHRVHEAEPVRDPALANELLDLRRDVEICAPLRNLEPELLARVLHAATLAESAAAGARRRELSTLCAGANLVELTL